MRELAPPALLAAAFHDDPMFVFIEPDEERRRRVLPWFFGAASRLGQRLGRLDIDPGAGAAVWLRPGAKLGVGAMIRSGLVLAPVRLGLPAMKRFGALTSEFDAAGARVRGSEYWHLFILGVTPGRQGQGVGSRLIAPVLAEADRSGQLCYLETLGERNLAFYARHRFSVGEHVQRPGLPGFWTMVRRPG